MPEKNTLGRKVATVRESRGITAEQLAERTELKPELVRQIEAGDLIPSLAPLVRIARVLGVRLGTFLDDHEGIGPVVARGGDRHGVVRFSDKNQADHSDLDFFSLAADKAGRHMEPFFVVLHPSSAQDAKLSTHEGEEFLFVVEGAIEIDYGREKYRLERGDSIYYDSIVPHNVHSAGGGEARIIGVVYSPS